MSVLKPERFEIEEFTFYWNVDAEKFKEKIKGYENILIAGFPPMGNIIPYRLKERLKDSEEIVSLYSYDFPPMVEAREEEFELPHDELWYSEEKRLFCYVGKYPETEYIPKSAYKQAEGVAHLAQALGIKELYTIGVIIPSQEPFRTRSAEIEAYIGCFEGSKKDIPEGMKKMTRRNIGRYTIIRKTGLLPGFASKLGIESYSILGVGKYPEDLRACARALRAFKKLSGLEMVETAEIEEMFEKSAEAVEERIREQREKAVYRGEGVGAEPSQYMYG
ncbi:MAG: PAC2 family protein, partial [Candidatus Methanospirareceae archaeon]